MSVREREVRTGDASPDTAQSLYEQAEPRNLAKCAGFRARRFIEAAVEEADVAVVPADSEMGVLGSDYTDSRVRVADINDDGPLELLLVYPNGTRQFVGEDETAKEDSNLFSFFVRSTDPLPPVRTTGEALDLLRPAAVSQAFASGEEPDRQGEWWLLAGEGGPAGSVFKPGVSQRPFGGSPLGNHVPREYGLGVTDDEFLRRFDQLDHDFARDFVDPQDVFDTVYKHQQIASLPSVEAKQSPPEMAELREIAEGVYVRGSLRHREREHYLEHVGEEWHRADTHDIDVYTIDQFGITRMD